MTNTPSKSTVKGDAKGAMAPSQGDSRNNGMDSANPTGDRDATRKPDDHSSPRRPQTARTGAPKEGST
ncbi:hypothetical protein [Methylopila turkensis]|uniref:Uncharacterized protein n=1 Tax=Methylopila turkensis TaxID=1437816 RepID=A0A9W6JML8_9HYPH|nr:hypothetical protein [Methylopila turkensis]GLK80416.1 hypothetical protein GCM10008174_21570 [Methylopila turkensis]